MKIQPAARIRELPPYLFADIDRKKVALRKQGKDLIDLGIGDPDLPTPKHIVQAMQAAAAEPRYHRYPSYEGMQSFREAAVAWYRARFGGELDAGRGGCAGGGGRLVPRPLRRRARRGARVLRAHWIERGHRPFPGGVH